MANYTFRAHNGLTAGQAHVVREHAHELVRQAAEGVNWNRLGAAPAGFEMQNIDGRMKPIHARTEIQFKPGFQMTESAGTQQWEGHASVDAVRLDLQSINGGWANWAVQTNGKNSVTVATCLMEVDKCFSQSQLAHALIQSATKGEICELKQ